MIHPVIWSARPRHNLRASVTEMAATAAMLLLAGISSIPQVENFPTIEWMSTNNMVSCIGQPDGFYTNSASSSEESFYRCENHRMVEQARCDPDTGLCTATPPLRVECAHAADGFFTMPRTLCRAYYGCHNGTRKDYTCPADSYFDITSQFCVRTGGVCHELVCTGRVNGHYPDGSHDCRRSYHCVGGVLQALISCPTGTRYNGTSCHPAEHVKCPTSDKSAVDVHILPTDSCADLSNGFQTQQDEACRGYLICHNGQTIAKLRCAPGDHFNGVKCAPARNSTCVSYCDGRPDGYISDMRRQCRGYVRCVNGKVVEELSCRDGSLFNGKSCVSALLYQCSLPFKKNICSSLKDGYHIDYMSSCKEYFYCHQGQQLLRSACRDGKVWNGSDCVATSDFYCKEPELWPGCSGKETGLYSDDLSPSAKCKYYHYCSDSKRVQLRCPDGFVFDGKGCVTENSFACPITDNDCNNKKDAYYFDTKSGCRSYFYCSEGQKLTYICPENHVFNGSECVDQKYSNCTTGSNICSNKTNGYHADEESGCHNYMYCLQGVLITSFECPDNYVFDGKKCIQFKLQNCPNTKQSCVGAEDGLYSEPNSQCTSYFKCTERKKTKTFTCREGKVFNGVKCVKYLCPSKNLQLRRKEDCVGRLGFFQDYNSRCTKYYFCINGVKTVLSCKIGQVFNGELCTSEKNYTCPFD